MEPPLSPEPYFGGSDDEKTIQEFRGMLASSMSTRDKAEKDRMVKLLPLIFLFITHLKQSDTVCLFEHMNITLKYCWISILINAGLTGSSWEFAKDVQTEGQLPAVHENDP